MTPEQIQRCHRALLEWSGWNSLKLKANGFVGTPPGTPKAELVIIGCPDLSLDWLREVAMRLKETCRGDYEYYQGRLYLYCHPEKATDPTIPQRLEALCRALGLWKEDKL